MKVSIKIVSSNQSHGFCVNFIEYSLHVSESAVSIDRLFELHGMCCLTV